MPDLSPIAIIAGNGKLPAEIATLFQARGQEVFVFTIQGEADDDFSSFPHAEFSWWQLGKFLKQLRAKNITKLILAGGIVNRPEISLKKIDLESARTLSALLGKRLSGDNALLDSVIAILEKRGFEVCSIAELLPELVVSDGPNTAKKPKAADLDRIKQGAELTRALGSFDVGQACVLVGRRAVAVEGAEGTDAMLERVAIMREKGRLSKRKGGVLVKAMKPGQNERADLPTIGPTTIEAVYRAGLSGIGAQAGKTLIVEKEKTLKRARELGLFVFGFGEEKND